jgi:hypothetical protein
VVEIIPSVSAIFTELVKLESNLNSELEVRIYPSLIELIMEFEGANIKYRVKK